jgi:hypothetical protein
MEAYDYRVGFSTVQIGSYIGEEPVQKIGTIDAFDVRNQGGQIINASVRLFTLAIAGLSVLPHVLNPEEMEMKTQFISGEALKITLSPFIDKSTGERIIGTDVATLVVKKPNGTLLGSPPTPTWDSDVNFWKASISIGSFEEGEWLIKATSDNVDALPQFVALTWGDYVDDIPETRQAAIGRWKIIGTQLNLYEDDGVTIFKTFDLKDADGNPSATRIFERDPV